MGDTLQRYLLENQRKLEGLAFGQPQTPPGGIKQPEGATTFPLSDQPSGERAGVWQQPTFGGPQVQQARAPQAAPVSALDPTQGQPKQIEPLPQGGGDKEEGENSFNKMFQKADDEQVEKAIGVMEQSGIKLDEAYQQATGSRAPEGMSRKEKGQILMEFGLNLMARSGSGEGSSVSDIGAAGLDTMNSYRNRKAAEAQAAKDADKSKQEQQLLDIRTKVAEAQLKRAEKENKKIETDANGNLVIVNMDTNQSTTVTDESGEPVKADPNSQRMYASQVDRASYEAEFCTSLDGNALRTCKRRAIAYAKGVREVAFPGVLRADQTERVMVNLEKPDNASIKYTVGGNLKRWRDMTPDEQIEVATRMVDRRIKIIEAGGIVGSGDRPGGATPPSGVAGGGNALGLPDELLKQMKPGKIYTLSDGREVRLVNGEPQVVK